MIFVLYDDNKILSAHILFSSYFYSLQNIYGKDNVKKFTDINEVKENDKIAVIDDHYYDNAVIYMNPSFVSYCNNNNIRLVFFTTERMSSPFWDHTNTINKQRLFNNVTHYYGDANDIKLFGSTFIVKQQYSKTFEYLKENTTLDFDKKQDKIVFIGQVDWILNKSVPWYARRKTILQYLINQNNMTIDIIQSDKNRTPEEYLKFLSAYKYVINPLGVGDFINIRFYDSLLVNSIPIQQYTDNMKLYYSELSTNKGLYFRTIPELQNIIENIHNCNKPICNDIWLEDHMREGLNLNAH